MGEHKKYVYLDYAATSPLCEEARFAIRPFFHTYGSDSICMRGNANSLYTPGRDANIQLEKARKTIATSLGAGRPDEIVFTSSSTESIYLALAGLFSANNCKTIVTSNIEHEAVSQAAIAVAGKSNVVQVKVDKFGFVDVEDYKKLLSEVDSPLVSIQMANSELASVQHVAQLAEIAHVAGCLFHTDITQAIGKVKVDLGELGVDAASWSSHKIGGPQGVGALYLRNKVKFASPIVGGGQENKRRGGTQNVSGAVGFAAAVSASAQKVDEEHERLLAIKRKLVAQISGLTTSSGKKCRLAVDEAEGEKVGEYLPNIATFIVPGVESETVILKLDEKGICVSGGSACSSHSTTPSSALKAVGVSDDDAFCELRVSFGRYTTDSEIETFVREFKEVI